MYNETTHKYDCDKCGKQIDIFDGIKGGLCTDCWLEKCKNED